METIGTADGVRAAAQKAVDDGAKGAANVQNVASIEVKNLIADVEDLVARIADLKDADVAKVRGQVLRAIDTAKDTLADSADSLRRQARRVAETADDYVHDSPWQAVGIAAVIGAVVGIFASRRS
jgi:ElaB/YqjD/DUF883 family membrane-anchored ribosome-binding protein